MQTMLEKRETAKSPLETEAVAGAVNMKDKNIVDDIWPTTCSTVSNAGRTASSILVNQLSPLRSIYDASLRRFAEEHKLGVGEDLTWKVYFVLVNLSYNVQKDRKDYLDEFEVFRINDMNDMVIVLEGAMKTG